MAFEKKTWQDRITEHDNRRTLTDVGDSSFSVVDISRTEGEIYQEGDAFNAENMNDLEGRINDALSGYSLVKTTEAQRGSDSTVIYFCT